MVLVVVVGAEGPARGWLPAQEVAPASGWSSSMSRAGGVDGTLAGAVAVAGVPLAAPTVEARIFVTAADPCGRAPGVETRSEAGPTASAADAPADRRPAAPAAEPALASAVLAAGG